MKTGAMFGLDARIALAIFGALSVISGAALYSAIQEAKVVKVIADINEVSKAIEQYLLDTGEQLPVTVGDEIPVAPLLSNVYNLAGWSGPYLQYELGTNNGFAYPNANALIIRNRQGCTWGGDCTEAKYYNFISLLNIDKSLALAVNKKIDNEDSVDVTGKVKVNAEAASVGNNTIWVQTVRRL